MFKVLEPGISTTIQDLGRPGFRSMGIPISGAADNISFIIGNLLVGNKINDAGIEVLLWGLKLLALENMFIAITGADLEIRMNSHPIELWRAFLINKYDVIEFLPFDLSSKNGCRSYICINGGLKADMVLGSVSTYIQGGLGGINGCPLEKEQLLIKNRDLLNFKQVKIYDKNSIPKFSSCWKLRIILGPFDNLFDDSSLNKLFTTKWNVTHKISRFGIRLSGPKLKFKDSKYKGKKLEKSVDPSNVPTLGVPLGGIEVVGSGEIIIIGVDGPSITGFSILGTVISADIWKLGQLKPDDNIRFVKVKLEMAKKCLRQQKKLFSKEKFHKIPICF
jgi:biotin-dependent carboxylase-like uncharacterized protein